MLIIRYFDMLPSITQELEMSMMKNKLFSYSNDYYEHYCEENPENFRTYCIQLYKCILNSLNNEELIQEKNKLICKIHNLNHSQ